MKSIQFHVGLLFTSAKNWKNTIMNYVEEQQRGILLKNGLERVRARCSEGCKWVCN